MKFYLKTIILLLAFSATGWADTTHVEPMADNCLRYNSGTPAQNTWNSATDANLYYGFHSSTYCYTYTLSFHPVLMKFDISGISSGDGIDSAFIYMYYVSRDERTGCNYDSCLIMTSRISRDWNEGSTNDAAQEGSVCWNARMYNSLLSCPGAADSCWAKGGCDSIGVDRSNIMIRFLWITSQLPVG